MVGLEEEIDGMKDRSHGCRWWWWCLLIYLDTWRGASLLGVGEDDK